MDNILFTIFVVFTILLAKIFTYDLLNINNVILHLSAL